MHADRSWVVLRRRVGLCRYLPLPASTPAAASEEDASSEHEPEVVPVAVVVDVVHVHAVGKQRDDERNWGNDPVPSTEPKPGEVATGIDHADRRVGSGRTRGQQQG